MQTIARKVAHSFNVLISVDFYDLSLKRMIFSAKHTIFTKFCKLSMILMNAIS